MSTSILKAHHHIVASYVIPSDGKVRYEVESEFPITMFVFDDFDLGEFKAGRNFTSFGGMRNSMQLSQELTLWWRGTWHLVLMNTGDLPGAVYYDVRNIGFRWFGWLRQ